MVYKWHLFYWTKSAFPIYKEKNKFMLTLLYALKVKEIK